MRSAIHRLKGAAAGCRSGDLSHLGRDFGRRVISSRRKVEPRQDHRRHVGLSDARAAFRRRRPVPQNSIDRRSECPYPAKFPAAFGDVGGVRYGIVWACLSGEPIWPLPVWSGIGIDFTKLYFPVETWSAGAPWHVENFNDLAHVPWIHDGTFARRHRRAELPHYEGSAYRLRHDLPCALSGGGNRFPDGVQAENRDVIYRRADLSVHYAAAGRADRRSDYILFCGDIASPVSAHESRIFQVSTDTTGDPDTPLWLKDTLMINDEDRPVVEAQYPKDLPLDVRDEMHSGRPACRSNIAVRPVS